MNSGSMRVPTGVSRRRSANSPEPSNRRSSRTAPARAGPLQRNRAFLGQMTRCDIEIIHLAVADNVVLTERVDHIIFDGTTIDARCMGTFEVAGDKITAWRDYFDSADGPA